MEKIIDSEGADGIFVYLDTVTIGGINQEDHNLKIKRFEQTLSKYGITLKHNKTVYILGQVSANVGLLDLERSNQT